MTFLSRFCVLGAVFVACFFLQEWGVLSIAGAGPNLLLLFFVLLLARREPLALVGCFAAATVAIAALATPFWTIPAILLASTVALLAAAGRFLTGNPLSDLLVRVGAGALLLTLLGALAAGVSLRLGALSIELALDAALALLVWLLFIRRPLPVVARS